jgi:hypothetical protein
MEIRPVGVEEFRQLGRRLKLLEQEGGYLRKALTKRLRAEMDPTVREVQSAVRAVQSHGVGGNSTRRRAEIYTQRRPKGRVTAHGLRESIARGIRSRISYTGRAVGAKIFIDSSVLPYSQRKLPRYLDGKGRWRHPVFGHRDRWVGQTGQPYFDTTIRRRIPQIRRAVTEAVNDTLKVIRG